MSPWGPTPLLALLDPVSGRAIRTVLRRFTERGGTVVISSHVMALVEQLCTTSPSCTPGA